MLFQNEKWLQDIPLDKIYASMYGDNRNKDLMVPTSEIAA
jgi:hypothetical protein